MNEPNYVWILKMNSEAFVEAIVGALVIVARTEDEARILFNNYFSERLDADPAFYRWQGRSLEFRGEQYEADFHLVGRFEVDNSMESKIILWPWIY